MPDRTPEDLSKLTRDKLEKVAAKAGVPNPDELPNKDAIVEAIETPNPALVHPPAPPPEPEAPALPDPEPAAGEHVYEVTGPHRVHDTAPGGKFAARLTEAEALLIESGHIKRTTPKEG